MSQSPVLDMVSAWQPLATLLTHDGDMQLYAVLAPEGTAPPYVVYGQTGIESLNPLAGITDADHTRLAFECHAKTRGEAMKVADALRDALDHAGPNGRPNGYLEGGYSEAFDIETRLYIVFLDWGLWQGRNPTPGGIAPAIP